MDFDTIWDSHTLHRRASCVDVPNAFDINVSCLFGCIERLTLWGEMTVTFNGNGEVCSTGIS